MLPAALLNVFPKCRNTYWLNNMDNIISLVSSGKLVKNKIWFGGCSGMAEGTLGPAGATCAGVGWCTTG